MFKRKPLFIAALIFSHPLYADHTDGTLTLNTMGVTANVNQSTLGGIDVKSLPIASTIVNSEEIKRLKYVDPDELLDRIPGESMTRNLRIPNGGKSYTISQLDGNAMANPLAGATQHFGTDVSAQDIERIEIFKGPVSALYGNNAFGGTINVITKGTGQLPEQASRAWFEAGQYNRFRGGLSTQGEIEGVGYMLDYSTWILEAYRKQAKIKEPSDLTTDAFTGEKTPGEERQQLSSKFIFHPDDVSSLVLRGSYFNRHETGWSELKQSEFDADDSQSGSKLGFYTDEETYIGSAAYKREVTDVDHLDVSFSYQYNDAVGPAVRGGAKDDLDTDITGELRWKHDFDFLNANLIVGTNIYWGQSDDMNPESNTRSRGRVRNNPKTFELSTTNINAGFAQLQFSPIENLTVTAGGRHESIELTYDKSDASGNAISGLTNLSKSFDATLPKVGVTYDFFENQRVFFGYGEGFLAPTTGALWTSTRSDPNPNLIPEEAEHFEVGLRGQLPFKGFEVTYDLSYYNQDITNYIVDSRQCATCPGQYLNAGKVNIEGVESVFEYQPLDWLRLGVTHTFADNIYVDYTDGDGVNYNGEEMRRSPHHHINGRVAVMPIEGLAIELGVDHQTDYSTADMASDDPAGRFQRDPRINLRATYDKGPYELWFHALNMGDVKEDRVGWSGRDGERNIRTVNGLEIYGGIAYNF